MAEPVKDPHAHDVLSGRGNFVNYHDGNEYFRRLVRQHKVEYVNCPKQQKGRFSKLIVEAIRARDPPGRFLKQDKDSKLWHDIGEKKALDKTRQALREGAPELMSNGQSNGNGNEDGDTAFNQEPSIEQQPQQAQQMHNSDYSILQQSIFSIGNDSFSPGDGTGMMSHGTFNNNSNISSNMSSNMSSNLSSNMSSTGLSPGMLSSTLFDSVADGLSTSDMSSSTNNNGIGNQTGGMHFAQIISPSQVHQPGPNMEQNMLQQQQQQQQREQEQQWQLRLFQQQQLLKQQPQREFTSQQQEEIIRNATLVMGNDFQTRSHMTQHNHLQMQHQPTKIHMDQLRINRQKEKRKLEQHILHNRQLELLAHNKFQNQNQLKMPETEYQQHPQQQEEQYPSSSEMRGALQSRLNAVYAGTDTSFEPLSLNMLPSEPLSISHHSQVDHSTYMPTATLQDSVISSKRRDPRGQGLVRENSLKMESIFEKGDNHNDSGGTAITGGTDSNKKKHNASAMSLMSASTTSISLNFEEESNLSAMLDSSMKIHSTGLNDQPPRSASPTPRASRPRSNEKNHNSTLLGMSLATIPGGGEKSSSSMSTDSGLARLFDDSAR